MKAGSAIGQVPFPLKDSRLLRSPDRKPGLADINRKTSRIKSFSLSEAIHYSYLRDLRFVLLLCLLSGFTLWSFNVPEQLLLKPQAICSPDLELTVRAVRDTFVNGLCTSHQIPSPCECGEPLNNVTRDLFSLPPQEETFDPLHLNNNKRSPGRVKAFSIFFASILSCMALAESVSEMGIRCT